jgi:hypothetical protein
MYALFFDLKPSRATFSEAYIPIWITGGEKWRVKVWDAFFSTQCLHLMTFGVKLNSRICKEANNFP